MLAAEHLVTPDRNAGATFGRYRDLGLLGRGSMAEVRRVYDPALDRAVAMKILKPGLLKNGLAQTRFKKEARAIARLQHPAIVPIHEIGLLPDGRPYYTMKVVEGRTLRDVIREVHARPAAEGSAEVGGVRRLVEALHRACEAVAFAHAHDVLHRDLKPDNIMLGAYGEVLVVDWGLAKVLADGAPLVEAGGVNTADVSNTGSVSGTPAYMAPEQAEHRPASPATDVYALGATLYEILSGRPPYTGPNAWLVLLQVKTGPPLPVSQAAAESGAPPVPEELSRIVDRALRREALDRHPDAGALAREIGAWLDGEARRERALMKLAEADRLIPQVTALREEAARLSERARATLAAIPTWAPVSDKKPAWDLEEQAESATRAAREAEIAVLSALRGALSEQPELAEAHARLADHYRARHAAAEAARDAAAAAEAEALLRAHDRGQHAAWLRGTGALTLRTDPPGAEVRLYRYALRDRRLVPELVGELGPTPLVEVPLDMGSWLLELRAPGRERVRYPVAIGRGERWDGRDPQGALGGQAVPVPLPPLGALRPDEVFLPPGPFWAGGDPDMPVAAPRAQRWTSAWVVSRFSITNQEYLLFLNDLAATGRLDEALRHAPRERSATPGEPGALVYYWDGQTFSLQPDSEGDMWLPEWPVVLVSWHDARAYAAWRAEREARPWQLLPELVWEKAARGVDGRLRPWGDYLEPTWCCMKESQPRALPVAVTAFPVDESPFGVRGVAGNVRSWCADTTGDPQDPAAPRLVRGGAWNDGPRGARVTVRNSTVPTFRSDIVGFRVGWPWGG